MGDKAINFFSVFYIQQCVQNMFGFRFLKYYEFFAKFILNPWSGKGYSLMTNEFSNERKKLFFQINVFRVKCTVNKVEETFVLFFF